MLITNESAAHQRIANKRGLNEETYHWLCRDTALKLTDAPVAHDSGMGGQFNVSNHLISLSRTDAAYQHPFCFPQRITRTRKLRTSNHAQNHTAPFADRQYRALPPQYFHSVFWLLRSGEVNRSLSRKLLTDEKGPWTGAFDCRADYGRMRRRREAHRWRCLRLGPMD